MKKFISIALTAAMCLGLSACSTTVSVNAPDTGSAETVSVTVSDSSAEAGSEAADKEEENEELLADVPDFTDNDAKSQDYQIEKVVVFSRHNMRAPTKSAGELLADICPYEWTDYTAPNGELTLLGGTQEAAMGEYFRKYFADNGLMEENWVPEEGQVRFYANSYQRTVATANYFASAFLPAANIDIEYHMDLGEMDPVFKSCLNMISDAYLEQVQEETDALADGSGMQGYMAQYADDIALIENVVDYKDSSYAKENGLTNFPMDESTITYELGEEPTPGGGLKQANSAADALIMQYYVQPDDYLASFGKELTYDQWKSFGNVQTMYNNLLFGLPSVAVNIANPLLKELKSEMDNDDRTFTFLCGHDSNMLALLVALNADDYKADYNLSDSTPIGAKFVWQKYKGEDGKDYAAFHMVYQDSEKLRANELVTPDNPPVWLEMNIEGLDKNEDGLYLWDDVLDRFDEAIAAFDALPVDDTAKAD